MEGPLCLDCSGDGIGDGGAAESVSDEGEEGDICGIIEADGLALEELSQHVQPACRGGTAWRSSALTIRAPRPAVVEDEDGDLIVTRQLDPVPTAGGSSAAAGLVGSRIELRHVSSSSLARVGLQLWAGALVLCDLLLARSEIVAEKRVCELGAGLGLCSMVAARLGAASVLCSDGSSEVVKNCEEILTRNTGCERVKAAVVSWENPPLPPAPELPAASMDRSAAASPVDAGGAGKMLWEAEVLLAADVVYDAPAAEALATLAGRLLGGQAGGGAAKALYLALEKRVYFSAATLRPEVAAYPQFLEDCAKHKLAVTPVDLTGIPVHFDYVRSRFYELVVVTAQAGQVRPAGEGGGAGGKPKRPRDSEGPG